MRLHSRTNNEFFDFYCTSRGEYTPKGGSRATIETISPRPLLFITGDRAHSEEFSEDAYKRACQPKELVIVPNAGHVDLYDKTYLIPFDKLETFFTKYLQKKDS